MALFERYHSKINEPEWVAAHSKIFELFYKSKAEDIIQKAKEIRRVQMFKQGWKTNEILLIFEVNGYFVKYKLRKDDNAFNFPLVFWEVSDFFEVYGSGMDSLWDILKKAKRIFEILE